MAASGWGRRIKYRLEYIGFRALAGLFGALPLETASDVSGWLWRKAAPRLSRHKRALRHLQLAFPEKRPSEIETIALGMWDNLGRTFAESFHVAEFAQNGRIRAQAEASISAFAKGGGCVICLPHMANWEVNSPAFATRGFHLSNIYQPLKNPLVDAYVLSLRLPWFSGGLFDKSASTPRRAMRHVRDGGALFIASDLRNANGISVSFFGRPAPSTPFPAIVAYSMKGRLAVACMVREPGVRFGLKFEELALETGPDREANIAITTAKIQAVLERFIRANPEQWMWAHRRWG